MSAFAPRENGGGFCRTCDSQPQNHAFNFAGGTDGMGRWARLKGRLASHGRGTGLFATLPARHSFYLPKSFSAHGSSPRGHVLRKTDASWVLRPASRIELARAPRVYLGRTSHFSTRSRFLFGRGAALPA